MSIEVQGERQLKRLEIVIDVIFGITIWRLFMLLPRPESDDFSFASLGEFLASHSDRYFVVVLAILIVAIYWIQSNALFNPLKRTNNIHTTLSIFQVFTVLMMLYAISLGATFGGSYQSRLLESGIAVLMGALSLIAWTYANRRKELVREELTESDIRTITEKSFAEPLTALITVPFAFMGPGAWELSWFVYPVIKYGLTRRKKSASNTVLS